jgi:hypothetical protein
MSGVLSLAISLLDYLPFEGCLTGDIPARFLQNEMPTF